MDGQLVESVDCPDHGDSLVAIRERVAAAIPGPWIPDYDFCDCGDGYGCAHAPWMHAMRTPVVLTEPGPGCEARDYHRQASEFGELPAETGRFIAHSRVDVETLLAEIDRLKSSLSAVMAALRRSPRAPESHDNFRDGYLCALRAFEAEVSRVCGELSPIPFLGAEGYRCSLVLDHASAHEARVDGRLVDSWPRA